MTPASRLTQELSTLDPLRMPAATLLREVERMAHRVGSEAAGADATDMRALQAAAAALKARIAARVATLTVLRDAMRAADRKNRGAADLYDAGGRRR
ncbi:MAG: hypothetical protein ACKOGH_14360 [Alphaproteobacteria bacterium]|nr:hypothetical protein [Alphaproteobacteria bacterium]